MEHSDKTGIWFAVINVYAASKKDSKSWEKAESRMKEKGMVYHGSRTGKAGNAMEITFDACMAGYRRIIAVGGDGTVHDVLNGIAAYIEWSCQGPTPLSFADFTIGVIPVGSGNDWIRTTGVPRDIDKAVDALEAGVVRPQDVVRVSLLDPDMMPQEQEISVSYMMNIGGVGIDARVCEIVNAKKKQGKRGKILYVTSLLYAISQRKPALAKVYCDGGLVFDGAYLSMAFGTGKYSGGGMRQTPEAVMDDGLVDLTVIPDIPLRRIAREIPRLFTGTFLEVPELTASKARSITVVPYEKSCTEPVEVDGEVVGKAPVRFDVLANQINVLVGR
jgi:YegS/Rv2252/BmrU family lipid kinase